MSQTNTAIKQTTARPTISTRSDAISLCERLNECIANMSGVLVSETEMLKSGNAPAIEELQSEKLKHTQAYLKDFTLFKDHASDVGSYAPVEVNNVRKTLSAFNETLQDNLNALAAAKAVSQNVVNVIAEAVREQQAGPTCYGANATVHVEGAHRTAAIAIDREF